jgi:hypothetical protein
MAISNKNGVVLPLIIDHRIIHLTAHMFPCHMSHSWILAGDHIGQKFVGFSLRYYSKWPFMAIFDKKWGLCGHWSSTRGSYTSPIYISLPLVTYLDFWWRPFLSQISIDVSLRYYWKWSFMQFSSKMGVVWSLILDQRHVHLTPHMFCCYRSHYCISGGDRFLVKNPYVLDFSIIENSHL